jgi:hypothetical protein
MTIRENRGRMSQKHVNKSARESEAQKGPPSRAAVAPVTIDAIGDDRSVVRLRVVADGAMEHEQSVFTRDAANAARTGAHAGEA